MSLEPHWIALILVAALIHASWNALNKASHDPLLSMAVLTASGGIVAGLLTPFVPPLEPAAWPWLAASAVLHFVYQLSLVRAYGVGDLSQVYPIARGVAPLGVALFAALVSGEVPNAQSAVGLVIAAGAIASLAAPSALFRRSAVVASESPGAKAPHPATSERRTPAASTAVFAALQTALLISLYTVVDGNGVRATSDGLSYIVWISFVDAFPIAVAVAIIRRRQLFAFLRTDGARNVAGGILAALGYGLVMAAMAEGAMASVSALRETSVVFAALIGTRLLGEPFGRRRLLSSLALALGLIVVQTS